MTPMRFLIVSDVHIEFMHDHGSRFFRELECLRDDYDIALLAGDIANYNYIPEAVCLASDHLNQAFYVLGNHEAFGATVSKALGRLHMCAATTPNVMALECRTAIAGDLTVLGATLWTRLYGASRAYGEHLVRDFTETLDLQYDAGARNIEARHALQNMQYQIVMTHHMPSFDSVHQKYQGHRSNDFFVEDCESIIRTKKPKLWVHGHTHEPCDYWIEQTRVVCNPVGYPKERSKWEPLIVEIP